MSVVRAVFDYLHRWYAWVEANKVGLASVGTAVGAVYNGVENGADGLTLVLAVAAVFGALTHLTSTPLSNPKTAQGVPLVPATPSLTVQIPAAQAVQLATGSAVTAPLPPPSGPKLGHLPSPRDDRDHQFSGVRLTPAVHNAAGLTFDPLGNLQVGDCAEAGEEHLRQVDAHLAGKPYTPTTAETVRLYSQVTGYTPSRPSSDQGTVLRDLLRYLKAHGVITEYQAVSLDAESLRAAIDTHGGVLCGFALPAGAQDEGVKWRVPRKGREAGSWGGHCVPLVGHNASTFDLVSWGEVGTVTHGFVTDYLDEAWALTYAQP